MSTVLFLYFTLFFYRTDDQHSTFSDKQYSSIIKASYEMLCKFSEGSPDQCLELTVVIAEMFLAAAAGKLKICTEYNVDFKDLEIHLTKWIESNSILATTFCGPQHHFINNEIKVRKVQCIFICT